MRTYCTYFDHRYLPRGLTMFHSLRRFGATKLWVLCLDSECWDMLRQLKEPGIEPISLDDIQRWAPELGPIRQTRSLIEFYFTLTPFLPRFILDRDSAADLVIYLDADLYFFADPQPLYDQLIGKSIGIIAHNFRAEIRDRERWGKYNVGFLMFRREREGVRCLDWWRQKCIEWCFDRIDGDRFADQKYLDQWPALFSGVHEIVHKGANLAPWNVGNYAITARDAEVRIDEEPLIFYHFHALKRRFGFVLDPRLRDYGFELTPPIRQLIYAPYLRALYDTERGIRSRIGGAVRHAPVVRYGPTASAPLREELDRRLRLVKEFLAGAHRRDYLYQVGDRTFG